MHGNPGISHRISRLYKCAAVTWGPGALVQWLKLPAFLESRISRVRTPPWPSNFKETKLGWIQNCGRLRDREVAWSALRPLWREFRILGLEGMPRSVCILRINFGLPYIYRESRFLTTWTTSFCIVSFVAEQCKFISFLTIHDDSRRYIRNCRAKRLSTTQL